MTRSPIRIALVVFLLAAPLVACTATPSQPAAAPAPAASPTAAPAAPADTSCEPRKSLRPAGPPPAPGQAPAGSFMDTVRKRGRLVVGTSQDTLLFSSRNPLTGEIEGFDVDLLREVARAIFGDPDRITIKAIAYDKRVPFTADGTVDIVADTMTINCARWKLVDFSSVYYEAGQKVLVSTGSAAHGIADLGGKRVCAAIGSTSIENLARLNPKPVAVGMPTQADCLVAFQQNEVDAISTDDTILAGLAAQDPYARVVGDRFTEEPYGMSVSKSHPEFTRFVNAVLDKLRADGTWARIYTKWLARNGPVPSPPPAQYRD
ncbi:MAG: polar amino acid transport system substrate-binding protein [Cryptosporangiaceae bacterium]|nr:polar amino acid transport system substrate-binding protein [Cryptosporangiaceae bacterium]